MKWSYIALLPAVLFVGSLEAQSAPAPYAIPSSAAYADLNNAAKKIVSDAGLSTSGRIVIYDPQMFSMIPVYEGAVQNLRDALASLCADAAAPDPRADLAPPTLDIGGAASGLAALITAVTPSYSTQGQAVAFDNSALVAAFAAQFGDHVVIPGYLVPPKPAPASCENRDSASFGALWEGASIKASALTEELRTAPSARQKVIKKKLEAHQKVRDAYLAVDKGTSLFAKMRSVEGLLVELQAQGGTFSVIDLKLDGVGMDSTIRTIIGFRTSKLSCSVQAHYVLLRGEYKGNSLNLKVNKVGTVNTLAKDLKFGSFGGSGVPPSGPVN